MTPTLARPRSSPAWERRPVLGEGVLVAGTYRVLHLLGEGSWAEVWAATDTTTGARVALKVLATGTEQDLELAERFRREAFFLSRTAGEHVARIHDFVRDPDVGMVLVMELVEGESLTSVLDRGTLSVEDTVALGIDLLAGVGALHGARVIHRDLKPGNILMRPGAEGLTSPVLCDFGLSRLAERRPQDSVSGISLTGLTKGDVALGTVRYMAPEQVLDARGATVRSDLYAVAAILHRAVCGAPPFGELDAPADVARAKVFDEAPALDCGRANPVARGLARVLGRALRRRPAERYASAAAMREELMRLAEVTRLARDAGETERLAAPAERAPRPRAGVVRALTGAGVLALVFGAGVATGRLLDRAPDVAGPAREAIAEPSQAIEPSAAPPLTPTPELVLPPVVDEIAADPQPAPARDAPHPRAHVGALPAPVLARAAVEDDNPY